MDPLADKLTQIAVVASLAIRGIVPFWIVFIIFIKETAMIIGASFLYGKKVIVYSKWYGKLATVLLYVAIVFSLLRKAFGLSGIWAVLGTYIFYLAIFFTVFSLIMYVRASYKKGFIDKNDLNQEVIIDRKAD